jgi:nitroreductase
VEKLLRAAMMAPSAGNQQPWEFIVLTDRALLDEMPGIHPYCQMIRQAPVAVLVCGNVAREKHPGYWPQDCSAAITNLLLAAHALGLGAVWTGIYPRDERVQEFRAKFGLPEHVVPLALIPIGWPAETPPQPERHAPERVHRNTW